LPNFIFEKEDHMEQQEEKNVRPKVEAAEAIRAKGEQQRIDLLANLKGTRGQLGAMDMATAIGAALIWGFSWLPEIAAQLAEINSRDSAAELRAKDAETFVAGIQDELARSQGVIAVPSAVVPQRGR
jgi:hypothetical protein